MRNPRKICIAIDGPAGAGKSTLAKLIARDYGYQLIDTGAMYRTVGIYALKQDISLKDAAKLEALCHQLTFTFEMTPDLTNRVFANAADVTHLIRSSEASIAASDVSKVQQVREVLVAQQQAMSQTGGVVMEGRDIGTVVLPHAEVKFYLTATAEERAKRRLKDLHQLKEQASYERVLKEIKERDHQDSTRKHSPLKRADDAILIDTTTLPLEEVLTRMKSTIDLTLG